MAEEIVYEDISYKGEPGSLTVNDKVFHYQANETKTSVKGSWALVEKRQVSPETAKQHMIKLVLVSGKTAVFTMKERSTLEEMRNDMQNRMEAAKARIEDPKASKKSSVTKSQRASEDNNVKEGNERLVVDELVVLEEGLANHPSSTLTNAEVVIESTSNDASRLSSSSQQSRSHLWERLPVATPIFDAEVEVWEYERPTFQKRFGFGLLGRSNRHASSEHRPRDPLFTDEDWANPIRCLCKVIGLCFALPLYPVYFVFCKVDVWAAALYRMLDCVLFRPTGWVADWCIFGACNLAWVLYHFLLVPIYTVLVYFTRSLYSFFLWLVKYVLLIPIDCIYLYTILPALTCIYQTIIIPVHYLTTAVCSFIYDKLIVPCGQGIQAVFTSTWKRLVAALQCIYKNLFLPCAQCIHSVFAATWNGLVAALQCIYKNLFLPCAQCIHSVFAATWNGIVAAIRCLCYVILWQHMILPAYEGIVSGVQWAYRNILVPTGMCFYNYLVQPIILVYKAIYEYVLAPMGRTICVVFKFIRDSIRSGFRFIRDAIRSVFRFIQDVIRSLSHLMTNLFRF